VDYEHSNGAVTRTVTFPSVPREIRGQTSNQPTNQRRKDPNRFINEHKLMNMCYIRTYIHIFIYIFHIYEYIIYTG